MGRPRIRPDCEKCGVALTGQASRFCSRPCAFAAMRTKQELTCQVCEKKFHAKKYETDDGKRKFCSHACYSESMVKPELHIPCIVCGTKFMRSTHIKFKNSQACSHRCRTVNMLGRSKTPSEKDYRTWMIRRNLVKKCNRCNFDKHPEILVIHHKDRDRKNAEISNLEVLCPNCHAIEHYGESKRYRRIQNALTKVG